jgi:hypothetical protein
MTPTFLVLLCTQLLEPVADLAHADVSDPAVSQVQTLTATLLQSMQAGPAEPMSERYRRLEPVINQVIDVYFDGISELTLRRDDFGAAIAASGPLTLIAHLHKLHHLGKNCQVDLRVGVDGHVVLNAARLPQLHENATPRRRRSRRISIYGLGFAGYTLVDNRTVIDRERFLLN